MIMRSVCEEGVGRLGRGDHSAGPCAVSLEELSCWALLSAPRSKAE